MLRLHPERIPAALEELLRFYTPAQYAARTVMKPVEIGGQQMWPGERVMISWAAANHDPDRFDDPDEVRLDRPENHHLTFGLGRHTCMGLHLGRLESRIMVSEILKRMPDYRVVPGAAERYTSIGTINGWVKIPVTFTPGPRSVH